MTMAQLLHEHHRMVDPKPLRADPVTANNKAKK